MATVPILFTEVLNLTNLGIAPDAIKFGSCTMQSSSWIVSCSSGTVSMLDLSASPPSLSQRPIAAEAAMMSPGSQLLALRSGESLQIFDLARKAKVSAVSAPDPVVHWSWVGDGTVAVVTAKSVFHWKVEGSSLEKVFDRHASLPATMQITNYEVSADGKWCLLGGIMAGENGAINGGMQLYSTEKKVSQPLSGHAAAFATLDIPGRADQAQVLVFHQKSPDNPTQKLYIMEVGRDPSLGTPFKLLPQTIPVPADAAADFPVSITMDKVHSLAFLISKMGYLYVFDVFTGKALYRARVSQDTVFAAVGSASGAMLGLTARKGQLLSIAINKEVIVPYIVNTLQDNDLAIKLSGRLNLPGAEPLYKLEFEKLLASNDVAGAVALAASSGGSLRTNETIARFQSLPAAEGQPQPVFLYFSALLELGGLNELESIELTRPVIAQGRPQLLEKWLKEDKLTCSEPLGDMIMPADVGLALSVYLRAKCHSKAVACFAQRGEYGKIVQYNQQVGHQMDYKTLLNQLVFSNPAGAVDFAKALATAEGGPLIDLQAATDTFLSSNRVQEATSFLLEALKENKAEHAFLQTKLLEINLIGGAPQVADAILQNKILSHFDKEHVAKLCERAGLWQRAAENFTDIADVKRVFKNSHAMDPDFILSYFSTLSADNAILLIKDMLSRGASNLQIVVEVAKKYSNELGALKLIAVFEQFKAFEGMYYYLGAIVNFSEEPEVHLKYIQAAASLGQFKEAERVCRDSTVYDATEVKNFLKDAKLADPRPLIHVCDRHGFEEELAEYLYTNGLIQYIEIYVTKVSPAKTPIVVGKLLELDANEDLVKKILLSVGGACPVDEMVEIAESRNRLRLLQPWLETRVAAGSTEPATHNALGKIYITLNKDSKAFLLNNMFYEPTVLGKFCESLDPSLSFLAYKRANGECDEDLIRITNGHGLFRELSRYCVERMDATLWEKVLVKGEDGEELANTRSLIDQIVDWALPESDSADEVSATVKAFLAADIPGELINLLERIVLQGSDFSENRNLQNLLILTAIQAAPQKVSEYIDRLDHFDGPEIAQIAISEQHELFEEGLSIYQKFAKPEFETDEDVRIEMQGCALSVLVDHLADLDRARSFAERCNQPTVWSKLGRAQLDAHLAAEAIASYLAAEDPSEYVLVAEEANEAGIWETLIPFLRMARKTIKENGLDTELIYSLAKTDALAELEEFVSGPNCANIQDIGDRCFHEEMFAAAKLMFLSINNNAKVAICYVRMSEFREAVAAATKANAIATWKAVCWACVAANEFKLACACGLHVIMQPDHLDELVNVYEQGCHFAELISLMEQGLGDDSAHNGIFTELAILYSKHDDTKLAEHIKIFFARFNVAKVVKACERARLWVEQCSLFTKDKQFDNAVKVMITNPIAFNEEKFLEVIVQVRNQELLYKSITFFLDTIPTTLDKLLHTVIPQLDHARVVHLLKGKGDHALELAQPYLKEVQKENLSAVNTALNDLFLNDEDYDSLRTSIVDHTNFDQIALAQQIETHELLEFRRIAAFLYRENKRWELSVTLSKRDKMYKDAIDTTHASGSSELVDDLLRSFCEIKEKESFCATLYTCYELVSPDVALELGWRNGFVDFIVPFMVETFRKTHLRLAELEKKVSPPEEEVAKAEMSNAYGQQSGVFGNSLMITNGGGPAGFDPATGGYPGDPSVAGPLYGAPMTMSMGMGGGYQ